MFAAEDGAIPTCHQIAARKGDLVNALFVLPLEKAGYENSMARLKATERGLDE